MSLVDRDEVSIHQPPADANGRQTGRLRSRFLGRHLRNVRIGAHGALFLLRFRQSEFARIAPSPPLLHIRRDRIFGQRSLAP